MPDVEINIYLKIGNHFLSFLQIDWEENMSRGFITRMGWKFFFIKEWEK